MSNSLQPHGLYSPWNSPGQNTGAGSLSLLQGIFPTQGSNPGLLHCRRIVYQLSHKGSPRTLEWVAYPFSSGSPQAGVEPGSPALQADSLPTELSGKPWASESESEVAQLCLTLCDPMDCVAHQSPLSMGILQARILEWVVMSSSRGSSQPRDRTQLSCIAGRFFTN